MSVSTIKKVFLFLMVQALDEDQGPSLIHGHTPWLMYEVALKWGSTRMEQSYWHKLDRRPLDEGPRSRREEVK